ncbi:hypothetical protein D9619_007616 [Psilocybe cf. subviscida]|uniref:Peptidase S53 domain-containing protein n=1 Tax=Psilocybe cf. subviscida TaxID=2480587 RepID=A0A8H5EWK7_9AGAR|nr:hypothetical protein D9619_007616 [Psilocybe cf. subviscida]
MRTGFLVLAAFVASAWANPSFHTMRVHEARSDVPDGFIKKAAAPVDTMLNLRIALKQTDMAGLEQMLFAVSTPGSETYGQHLTKEEVSTTTHHVISLVGINTTFPSGCPFMTSVGATTGVTETAADFSSGGFSNFFGRPSYQASAVSSYLTALGSTNSGKFNTSGRAFPDVSAQGENVEIVVGGQTGLVAGTSCSSPIFASVISLLNDQLLTAGKSPLGFLNPFLYSSAGVAALNDITTGSNPGCNTNGFPAKTGWDPVTGLGTPNFAKLKAAVGL